MNKAYVIVPLAAVLVFGGIYYSYSSRRDAFIRAHEEEAALALRAQQQRDQAAQVAATEAANTALAQRKQERLEKEKREAAQKQAQLEAEQRREHAFEQERKLRSQVERRRADIQQVKDGLVLLERRHTELADEIAFLAAYLPEAEANRDSLFRLLEKWEAAHKSPSATGTAPAPAAPKPGKI